MPAMTDCLCSQRGDYYAHLLRRGKESQEVSQKMCSFPEGNHSNNNKENQPTFFL
jgi:hypothetical protein